jgi:cytochrome c biogenesis protein CcmG/thiol:disulfide interchange protein DsbE
MTHQPKSPDTLRRKLLIGSAAAVAASFAAILPRPASANALVLGRPAPPLTLHSLDGRHIATTDLIGKIVVVTFWASYCEPCMEELPLLSRYAEQHAADGLQVLGFCIDPPDNVERVKQVAGTLSFPVGLLGSPYAGSYGRIWRMPVSFVIDRAGNLVDNGWNDSNPVWTPERLHRILDPLLAGH